MAGKKYSAALAMVDRSKTYSYTEAVALAQKTTTTKFDSSVEVSFSLNVDPRQAEQNIRGALVLPNGTGRTQRVLVITQGPKVEEAKAAGADFVGGKEMLEQIQGGWFDFDVISILFLCFKFFFSCLFFIFIGIRIISVNNTNCYITTFTYFLKSCKWES